MDNKGAVYLANNWSMGGQTHHMDVWNHFVCELNNEGLMVVNHASGDENEEDIFTKNTTPLCSTEISLKVWVLTSTLKKATCNLELGRVLEHSF